MRYALVKYILDEQGQVPDMRDVVETSSDYEYLREIKPEDTFKNGTATTYRLEILNEE